MKRGIEESYGLVKRPRAITTMPELRILISSKGAGAVIGRGGDNIKRLRTELNVDIAVPDSATPERVVNITTTNNNLEEIITEVMNKVEEVCPRANDSELRILVHSSQAGAIIGRSGTKIKELREGTGTNIAVLTECCPMSTDRVIIIEGEMKKIIECVQEILKICSETPIKGVIRNYDASNYEPTVVDVYGGFPPPERSGRGGRGGGRGGMYGGGRPGLGFGFARATGMTAGIGGLGAMAGMRRGGGFGRGMGSYGDYEGFGAGGYGGAAGYMDPSMAGFEEDEDETEMAVSQFTIPGDLAGTIIGKGGDRINRIRDESGAQIVVNPPEADSTERVITIRGTGSRIQAAKFLLQQCVRASPAGRRYIQLANS